MKGIPAGRVRLEVLPWATKAFDSNARRRLVVQEDIGDSESVADLFARLAGRYQAFGRYVFDPQSRKLTGEITVIYNGAVLELAGGLDAVLKDGDNLLLLPAFAGGQDIT